MAIFNFRNIGRFTFGRSKFRPPPKNTGLATGTVKSAHFRVLELHGSYPSLCQFSQYTIYQYRYYYLNIHDNENFRLVDFRLEL